MFLGNSAFSDRRSYMTAIILFTHLNSVPMWFHTWLWPLHTFLHLSVTWWFQSHTTKSLQFSSFLMHETIKIKLILDLVGCIIMDCFQAPNWNILSVWSTPLIIALDIHVLALWYFKIQKESQANKTKSNRSNNFPSLLIPEQYKTSGH